MADGNNFFNNLIDTPDYTVQFDPQDVQANKAIACLSYLGILFFLPLVVNGGNSRYGKFHANQAFILFLAGIVVGVVGAILGLIPYLGALLAWLLRLALFALTIYGMVNAGTGKAKELPLVGGLLHVFDK